MNRLTAFEPTSAAALARVDQIDPVRYAKTRNALDGDVTGLSPYLTHGVLSLPQVTRRIRSASRLSFDDKLVFEFAWREFFHHVWSRAALGGDAILQDMRAPQVWRGRYAKELPADIAQGQTGVPCIDAAVRCLYDTGYLHNHARMWLASYVVHLRKVHWRAGADWMYAHLLDGDLPSNHLSWQWVAATFSSKPYVFNADNVAKFAPRQGYKAWISPGTVIDDSYEALEDMARNQNDCGPQAGVHARVDEPDRYNAADALVLCGVKPMAANDVAGLIRARHVQLVHPWALADRVDAAVLRIGVLDTAAHQAWRWGERRWRFVLARMQAVCDAVWLGDLARLDTAGAASVQIQSSLFPHYRQAIAQGVRAGWQMTPQPRLLPNPSELCGSFTKFYERARREAGSFERCLHESE
jgi:deoxyribodipyrimidine photo-lyase